MTWTWASEFAGRSRLPTAPPRGGAATRRPIEQRILALQATAGNAAVQRFLQREAATEAPPQPGGSAPTTHSILRYGARGEEVRLLQQRLNAAGGIGARLVVDGIMGPKTTAALRRFQRNHPPLVVDGAAGPDTWAVLEGGAAGSPGADAREADAGDATSGGEATLSARDLFERGKEHYSAGRYAQAFDEFSKAHEIDSDRAYLFNMAQAMRNIGGRREEAIALFEQFLASDASDEEKATAKERIAELRGPGPSGDKAADHAAVDSLFQAGRKHYQDERYGQAYDEFTKAWNITHDPALLWNRAQAIRLLGGRRSEAISLYEQVLVTDVPEDKKAAARTEIADLRGTGPTGDKETDDKAVADLHRAAVEEYQAERYARAYDAFTKAWEITRDPAMLWNRAQSLRLLGGRRAEAINLYEQVLAQDIPEDNKKTARIYLVELRGPVAQSTTGGDGARSR